FPVPHAARFQSPCAWPGELAKGWRQCARRNRRDRLARFHIHYELEADASEPSGRVRGRRAHRNDQPCPARPAGGVPRADPAPVSESGDVRELYSVVEIARFLQCRSESEWVRSQEGRLAEGLYARAYGHWRGRARTS